MNSSARSRFNKISLCICGLALASLALMAPSTASACGTYGKPISAAELPVLAAAKANVSEKRIVVGHTAIRIDDDKATIWLEIVTPQGGATWEKFSLEMNYGVWLVRSSV